MSSHPKVFVSHSHADKPAARALAMRLRSRGLDAWFDEWEIKPGDSLITKIFDVGLKDCAAFLILLSPDSIQSNWVRHELDVAMVQRIEDSVRVIPVVIRPCDVPLALRALLRVDASSDSDEAARRIADVVLGRDDKPAIRQPLPQVSVPGLRPNTARIASILFQRMVEAERPVAFSGKDLSPMIDLSAEQIDDAVAELQSLGLAKIHRFLGTYPYNFGLVEPTYMLPIQLAGTTLIDYDPMNDILLVAVDVADKRSTDGPSIASTTELPPLRVNHAVRYLEDYGVVHVIRTLGTAPFDFAFARATAATRRFVEDNAK